MATHKIIWSERYGDATHKIGHSRGDESELIFAPESVIVDGDIHQARWVAKALSDQFPGEDYCYVVEGDEE